MTPLFNRTNALAAIILFTATIVNGFTPSIIRTTTSRTQTSLHFGLARRKTKTTPSSSSPLLEEALSSYPYKFRPDTDKSGTKASCSATFNELARLYGDEEALAMVKLESRSLRFNRDNFGPCLEAWEEQFGLESSQAMVGRNPGLLSVSPMQAREPAEASMFFSYVVAVTRPLPQIAVVGGLLAILTAGIR
eukprot:CAMPEP_0201605788 /NCGR_PEP_ID=MMETSP0492-20130828/5485_1 /ASSEMBLY_ACC=CAM_ASM_000837 /TAXON_ID=420259 /ORGANISM="Thalassiosira gravida, Strain GMp14c1" /LENGTH=191 /DNA_ID=CAMNT_0048070103 /DNA_START=44 /DNA_END=619 /DNA_ORIENTATION=+